MGLAEALQPRTVTRRCAVAELLDRLDADDRKALTAALDAPWRDMSAPAICAALRTEGVSDVGESTINKHRRGTCCCGPR